MSKPITQMGRDELIERIAELGAFFEPGLQSPDLEAWRRMAKRTFDACVRKSDQIRKLEARVAELEALVDQGVKSVAELAGKLETSRAEERAAVLREFAFASCNGECALLTDKLERIERGEHLNIEDI